MFSILPIFSEIPDFYKHLKNFNSLINKLKLGKTKSRFKFYFRKINIFFNFKMLPLIQYFQKICKRKLFFISKFLFI